MNYEKIKYISNQISLFPGTTNNLNECIKYLSNLNCIAVDTETEGLFNHSNKIIMLQIGNKERQYVIDVRTIDISPLSVIFSNSQITKVFHNASFDYKFLRFHGFEINNIWDTQLAEMVLTTGLDTSVSLQSLAKKYLNEEMDKTVRTGFNKNTGEFTVKQIEYGAKDVELLLDIKKAQEVNIVKQDLQSTISLENEFVHVLADIEYNGFYLDPLRWLEIEETNSKELQDLLNQLDAYIIDNNHTPFINYQYSMFDNSFKTTIQWSSPTQVIKFLDYLGINTEVVVKGETKKTCEASHLQQFKHHPFVKLYLSYKAKEKEVSTYGSAFLKNINKQTKRVHSNYWQIVSTGRISSSNPNLQNIPNTTKYRSCFRAQNNNNVLVIADFSAQEQRVLADKCKDPSLLDFYENGDGDMHCLIARRIYPELSDKTTAEIKTNFNDKRQFAKIIGFTLNYGGSDFTVANRLLISQEEAKKLLDNYFKGFPKMTAYFNRIYKETLKNGYILIDNVSKRKSYLPFYEEFLELDKMTKEPGFWDSYRSNKKAYIKEVKRYFTLQGEIKRMSQNYPIQGTSGSITKLAAIYLKRALIKANIYHLVKIVNLVHDEIVVESDKSVSNKVATILSESMEKAGHKFCQTVPLPAVAEISDYWTH